MYKRQVMGTAAYFAQRLLAGLTGDAVATAISIALAAALYGLVMLLIGGIGEKDILMPVSYTHLDVYKRQDQDDLISIGVIGLIKAIKTFDISKNTRLATYAARCVENEIFMHFRTLRRISCEVSLSEPIDTDCEGNTLELMDILSFEEDMFENLLQSDKIVLLRSYIQTELDPREREILILRYGLNDKQPLTQRETAERLGISRSYVSRIEKAAIETLRAAFEKTK